MVARPERRGAYRVDLLRTLGAGTLEAGTHVSRFKASRQDPSAATAERPDEGNATDASPRVLGSWAQRSGYLHVTWEASPHLTLASDSSSNCFTRCRSFGRGQSVATTVTERSVTRSGASGRTAVAAGLSGWIGYSYGTARYRDVETGASAWADFDQRHSVTTAGAFRLSDRTSVSAQFRAGTNFPAGGEWVPRERGSVAAPRSDARLAPYGRLDVRASRALVRGEQRLTLFVEVLSVLDRNNQGHSPQFVQGGGDSSGSVDGRYFPRRPSAGLRVEF